MLAQSSISWVAACLGVVPVALIIAASGLLVRELAIRTADGRFGRNSVAGIRTAATGSSDEAWRAAHKAGEWRTKIAGNIAVASGLAAILLAPILGISGAEPETYLIVGISVAVVGVLAMTLLVVLGAVAGNRAAVAVRDGAER